MTGWLYSGSSTNYCQHKDVIWVKHHKDKNDIDQEPPELQIKDGDSVIYFDDDSELVMGIFGVDSKIDNIKDDLYWSDSYVLKIIFSTILPENKFFDLPHFLLDNPDIDKILKNSPKEQFTPLDNSSFEKIQKSFFNPLYHKKVKETTGKRGLSGWRVNPDLLAGLLDYYNSRAVSFASLLVASIFGLVTMSAIVTQVSLNPSIELTESIIPSLIASTILFGIFSAAGLYMLKCYSYYTAMADKVKVHGLQNPYFKDLQKITFPEKNGPTNLIETIYDEQKKHANSFPKRCLNKYSWIFAVLFIILIILLAWAAYYPIAERFLNHLFVSR